MAAINEAWFVLRDPGRRAMYDAGLRGADVGGAARGATGSQVDDLDDLSGFEPVQPGHPLRWGVPLGWVVVIVVLGAIFVFTAYATSSRGSDPSGRLLHPGACVAIEPPDFAVKVPCTSAHAGVIQSLPPFDQPCPSGSSTYRDRQAMSQVCVIPG